MAEKDDRQTVEKKAGVPVPAPLQDSFLSPDLYRHGLERKILQLSGGWTEGTSAIPEGIEAEAEAEEREGVLLGGRYRLGRLLGRGGFGDVYRAFDEKTRSPVAVKAARRSATTRVSSFRHEVAILRLLRIPGTVQLLDEGGQDGLPYLVMELVDGRPFPGVGVDASWASVAETVVALFETLDRIHHAGFIHGDLKPANVLVDEAGVPVILDLGLATATLPDGGRVASSLIAGTPAYMAPETLEGMPATIRSDLYSAGAMILEASCSPGLPLPCDGGGELSRAWREESLARLGKDGNFPQPVVDLLRALLKEDPSARPATAAEVLHRLGKEARASSRIRQIPPLGKLLETRDRVLELLRAGAGQIVMGPPGTGKTRLLEEVARCWAMSGGSILWIHQDLEATPEPQFGDRVAAASSDLGATLTRRLDEGGLVLVDDLHRFNPTLKNRILSSRATGPLLASTAEGDADAISLPILEESDWLELFQGPDRVFHLREDPARRLHAAGAGNPAQMSEVLASWVRSGLASWEGEKVRVSREAVERIGYLYPRQGPSDKSVSESPATTAEQLALELRRFTVSREYERLAPLGRELAARLREAGQPGKAVAVCWQVLAILRSTAKVHGENDLLEELLLSSIAAGTVPILSRALYEFEQAQEYSPYGKQLKTLCHAALLGTEGDPQRALDMLNELEPFDSLDLELSRHWVLIVCARRYSRNKERETLAGLAAWAASCADPRAHYALANWQAWERYGSGEFQESIALQERAVELAPSTLQRSAALLSLADALKEDGQLARAAEAVSEAVRLSATMRLPLQEGRALVLERIMHYRQGRELEPDGSLVEIVSALGMAHLEALAALTEAAVAWRCSRTDVCQTLAQRAARLWRGTGQTPGRVLAEALAIASGDPKDIDPEETLQSALECGLPGVTVQVVALLGLSSRPPERLASVDTGSIAMPIPRHVWKLRREILSIDEALAMGTGLQP